MKLAGQIITEFVGLRSKMYSYIKEDDKEAANKKIEILNNLQQKMCLYIKNNNKEEAEKIKTEMISYINNEETANENNNKNVFIYRK